MKKPLSEAARERMTQMLDEVLEPAMKRQAQRNPEDFVYMAPEVWRQHVMNVGARIVNRAITIAYEEWSKDGNESDSCAYCLEVEHGHKGDNLKCTCANHCGATVCMGPLGQPLMAGGVPIDVELFAKCPHEPTQGTSRCAAVDCPNYLGNYARRLSDNSWEL